MKRDNQVLIKQAQTLIESELHPPFSGCCFILHLINMGSARNRRLIDSSLLKLRQDK